MFETSDTRDFKGLLITQFPGSPYRYCLSDSTVLGEGWGGVGRCCAVCLCVIPPRLLLMMLMIFYNVWSMCVCFDFRLSDGWESL